MDEGGEYGELAIELAVTLASTSARVTESERDELRLILEATGMPTEPIAQLTVIP
ncbi:MAG TPA: hypothetical protein VLW50_28065 [Streptosporangiaceae bacterium]|nr:hypothetical protein [Streptosporangiaceae bacterium]